jgi:hypothetical protein
MLCDARVDVDRPAEIVARHTVAGDRQPGLEMQKVDTAAADLSGSLS